MINVPLTLRPMDNSHFESTASPLPLGFRLASPEAPLSPFTRSRRLKAYEAFLPSLPLPFGSPNRLCVSFPSLLTPLPRISQPPGQDTLRQSRFVKDQPDRLSRGGLATTIVGSFPDSLKLRTLHAEAVAVNRKCSNTVSSTSGSLRR